MIRKGSKFRDKHNGEIFVVKQINNITTKNYVLKPVNKKNTTARISTPEWGLLYDNLEQIKNGTNNKTKGK
uniref:Uncharacterized protein n=1 Tax=viral metagenome TaxID=1070528 RepID=A0A6C0EN01_9ZZZZ